MKLLLSVLVVATLWTQRAEACGCFAPPNAVEPVVQAGERILFSVKNGQVTAHIQIQYAGDAKDFGWLLPLPSVPTLEVGSDELFTRLVSTTQPNYRVQSEFRNSCPPQAQPISFGCSAPLALSGRSVNDSTQDSGVSSPLVVAASVGPYDYAVLKADDQTAMLQWLQDNRFFIPTGIQSAVGRYINPGAYFLALKLKAGASTGDVTPIVLHYASALPMIPLVLTSVGAQPNMGIQVWLLGEGRGIPRNFHHVVINDALLDWMNGVQNYSQVVTAAVAEAPDKHAFVTEYAGPSAVMQNQLAPDGRFGTQEALALRTTPQDFVNGLQSANFGVDGVLPSPVVVLLETQIPYPTALATMGIDEALFFSNLAYYLGDFRTANPQVFTGYTLSFDAPSLAQVMFEKYVTPMRAVNALFTEFPTLTRLYTTLSPQDMTADPVFAFNASLPEVKLEHVAKAIVDCGAMHLETEQGWVVENAALGAPPPSVSLAPVALRVEVLAEEGAPTVTLDNTEAVHGAFKHPTELPKPAGASGCTVVDPMSLGLFFLLAARRRRR